MATIKPFAAPAFTPFKNDALDYIMPQVSNSAWKILCVAIRKTWGWADDESPTGRKQWDTISYSQFRKCTGIKSDTTIDEAISECIDANFLLRRPSPKHKQQYEYALNTSLEIEVDKTSTENGEVTSTENGEVEAETSTVSVDTKESTKERQSPEKKKKIPASQGADAPEPGPASFERWLELIQQPPNGSNAHAQLKRMHDTLFPKNDPPSFGRIGTSAKRVGGPGRLCQLLWEAAPKRPAGNVLDYVEATTKSKSNRNAQEATRRVEF